MRVATFYFFAFGSIGVVLPYLPLYLRSLGLDGKSIALATSVPLGLMIAVPPLWGFVADRTGRPVRVLQILGLGASAGMALLLGARSLWAVLAAMAVYGFFHSAVSALADAVAVVEARRTGTEYARLRLWGSVGFVVTSAGFGAWLDRGGMPAHAPWGGLVLLLAMTAAALALPRGIPPPRIPSPVEALGLLKRRDLQLFFGASLLHWAALSPFHVLFALHFEDRGLSDTAVGVAMALGVTAEVAMMAGFGRVVRRFDLPRILQVAFLFSALRWAITGTALGPGVLVGIQVLHGLTFGAFFVGAILVLERRVPGELLATGRALFSSVVMGVGGIAGNALAGILFDEVGGGAAFLAAAGLDLAAFALLTGALRIRRAAPSGPTPIANEPPRG